MISSHLGNSPGGSSVAVGAQRSALAARPGVYSGASWFLLLLRSFTTTKVAVSQTPGLKLA